MPRSPPPSIFIHIVRLCNVHESTTFTYLPTNKVVSPYLIASAGLLHGQFFDFVHEFFDFQPVLVHRGHIL